MEARTREASAERLDASPATGGIANRELQPEFRHGRCWTLSAYEIWMRSVETQVRWAVSNATAERCEDVLRRNRSGRSPQDLAAAAGSACNSLPGLKRTALPGWMLTCCPVRGLRPMPVFRGFTLNTPNRRNSMRSPRPRAFFMASNTVSSACSALVRDTLGFFARMAFTMSSLITDPPVPSFWPETYARQGVCGLSSRPVIHCRARPIRKMAESKFRG